VVTRVEGQLQHWDIAHHIKMGTNKVAPGLNPKPGVRVPMSHSFSIALAEIGVEYARVLIELTWRDSAGSWRDAETRIHLAGYEALAA